MSSQAAAPDATCALLGAVLTPWRLAASLALTGVLCCPAAGSQTPSPAGGSPPALVVSVEFVVEDSRGRPVPDLTPADIEVIHGAEKQRVSTLEPGEKPGHYEVRYSPFSGQSGAVYMRSLRPDTRLRGPDGQGLKPRLIVPPSAAELEQDLALDAALEAGPADFPFRVAVFTFEASRGAVHHTVAVEIPLGALLIDPSLGLDDARLQVLARFTADHGGVVQRLSLDQPLVIPPHASQNLVWTGDVHLPPGRYALDILVGERDTGRSAVRTLVVEAPEPGGGLRISTMVLLQARDVIFIQGGGEDDPLVFGDETLMPDFSGVLPLGLKVPVRFLVVVYPDADQTEAPTLQLELYHEEDLLGTAPIGLPPKDARGEIRYIGLLATGSFRERPYTARLVARQGSDAVSTEASFEMRDWSAARLQDLRRD